jgi:hypothetical protein
MQREEKRCMGYSKLNYLDYLTKEDYWKEQGVELPKWSSEIYEKGGKPVCAIDFYDDIFGEDLEEQRLPEDYRSGEYGGIAVELIPHGAKKQGKRVTVTKGNMELYDLIDRSENFCMMSPISYAGKNRSNENARYLYALTIEIDNIQPKSGIKELFYSWNRNVFPLPKPTYIVCSGNGLHLYFVFERPIPLFRNIFEQLSEVKKHFTPLFWNKYVTTTHEKSQIQWESLNQPFRCVGTRGKRKCYALAFQTGEKVTIEYLNQFLPEELKMNAVYKSSLSLEQAKELYPEWYQKRIVEKEKGKGHWNRHQPIYYNWIEKIKSGAVVGKRYNCMENLCSLAVQCQIEPEQVEKDCREIAVIFEEMTEDEDNHFTEYDVLCALRTYHIPTEKAYRRKIEYISQKTGIELKANKRNGRRQNLHLKIARANRDILCEERGKTDWREGNGRKPKREIVEEWQESHPEGKKADCHRATGLDPKTIRKWWK